MKAHRVVIALLIVVVTALAAAQMVSRPYHNGTVWNMTFVHTRPGMDNTYLTYLTTDWKREQEALKQEGILLSYRVLQSESHTPADWNVALIVEYRDLATMEANQPKEDAIGQKLFGSDEKIVQGYKNRAEMREIIGGRVAREIILEPKK